jgi:dTMP kinase
MSVFITLEGIDGAGKSTQARLLAERLSAAGKVPVLTREPGGSPGAEEIRSLLVEGEPGRWSAETEILLFTAARRDHVERTILPALNDGRTVICDRFVDSTRAYQGATGLRDQVDNLHHLMIGVHPHLTLIFDLDPSTALARADDRPDTEDRFEKKGLEFQKSLRTAFLSIAKQDPARCRVIDADGSAEDVAARTWATVEPELA